MNNSQNKIAIIGAGNLGSRHLQSLASLSSDEQIFVVDPYQSSLEIAEERYKQVATPSSPKNINFVDSIQNIPASTLDCVVVATTANIRRKVIEDLLNHKEVKNMILEKVLFQKVEDYQFVENLLENKKVEAWVNLAQRMWPFFQEVKKKFELTKNNGNLKIHVSGSNWGLGCNAIHNIDILSFITGNRNIEFSDLQLDNILQDSKRNGFVEFTGLVACKDENGNQIIQESFSQGEEPFIFKVEHSKFSYEWDVASGRTVFKDANQNGKPINTEFQTPFQSQLTHKVIEDILSQGKCELPKYKESASLHLPMLKIFMEHIEKINKSSCEVCPIT